MVLHQFIRHFSPSMKSPKSATPPPLLNKIQFELDSINKILQVEQAAHQRKFLGERFSKNLNDLMLAENNLKEYKKSHGIISIEDQKKTAIESASAIKNQIMVNEVKIEVISSKLQSDHPDEIGRAHV